MQRFKGWHTLTQRWHAVSVHSVQKAEYRMFTVPDTASSQYSLKAQHSGRPAWQSFLSRDVVLAVLHSFWAWQKPASLFPYREITRLIVSNSRENSVLNADLREDWKRENIEFSREFNIKCVTLVSACVTLWNAARPLFTGVVSACQPIFQFFICKLVAKGDASPKSGKNCSASVLGALQFSFLR